MGLFFSIFKSTTPKSVVPIKISKYPQSRALRVALSIYKERNISRLTGAAAAAPPPNLPKLYNQILIYYYVPINGLDAPWYQHVVKHSANLEFNSMLMLICWYFLRNKWINVSSFQMEIRQEENEKEEKRKTSRWFCPHPISHPFLIFSLILAWFLSFSLCPNLDISSLIFLFQSW